MGFNLFNPSSWFSSGQQTTPGAPGQNPNAYQYGGQQGGAQAAEQGYAAMGTNARAQAAPQLASQILLATKPWALVLDSMPTALGMFTPFLPTVEPSKELGK